MDDAGAESGSSAGNTRGLIEALHRCARGDHDRRGLPRGIPAASLKRWGIWAMVVGAACLPRGIPAASLKRRHHLHRVGPRSPSSAGNTRGLIEAIRGGVGRRRRARVSSAGNTRGLIEASSVLVAYLASLGFSLSSAGNTRGLIEACPILLLAIPSVPRVFRGEYPRPH